MPPRGGGVQPARPLPRPVVASRASKRTGASMLTQAQIDEYNDKGAIVVRDVLSAEEVRDTMLAVAGRLRLEPMGGPGFRLYKFTQNNVSTYVPLDEHGPETFRRAVYHQNARASVVDVLTDFDLPDIASAAPRRASTTTPLQALTLLNHRFTFAMADALAARAAGGDLVGATYSAAFQRSPTAGERAAAEALVARHGAAAFCRSVLNASELIHLD